MKKNDMRQELVQLGNGAQALAIQILGNTEDAADAVHDAFVSVLSKPKRYDREKGPLKPWFYRVVRNSCIDLMRRRRVADPGVETLADAGPAPDQQLEDQQRDLKLQGALAQLNPDQRQILVLRDYLDLSYAEISAVLDIAQGTVMSRLHRARMALKLELESYDE
jgi:RNA polymerase sigma-70 factor (ECF subfamily)